MVPKDFDHRHLALLPEYRAARLALSNLFNAASVSAEEVAEMVATSYAADCCPCCDDPQLVFPHSATVRDDWMVARYVCPETQRQWKCGWTTNPSLLPL